MTETAIFEDITPARAIELLDKNKHNRQVNQLNLNKAIMDIERGNFKVTGESIKVSKSDVLLDGQHRLWAIVKTRTTVRILVVTGLEDDVFKYLDTGRTRKASDVLAIEGIKNPSKVAAIAKFIINYERGQYIAVAQRNTQNSKSAMITNADVSNFVNKHLDELNESYEYGFNKYNKLVSGSTLSAFHFIFNKIHSSDADDFCHKVAEGTNIDKTSPIFLLREKLRSDIRSTRKMSSLEKIALICKSWNAYRSKKTLTLLKWDSIKEPFPKPI